MGVLRALPHHVDDAELLTLARLREEAIAEGLEPKRIRHAPTVNCNRATLK